MVLGRKNGKLKIKTDGEAALRAVSCGCCDQSACSGCGALEDVLTATSVIGTLTSSGSPTRFGENAPCRDGTETNLYYFGGCSGPTTWDNISNEGELAEAVGFSLEVARGSYWAFAYPDSFIGDPSKCYVALFFEATPRFFLVSGPNSVSLAGTYSATGVPASCFGFSIEDCPGEFNYGENGSPDTCLFEVNATLTIS